MRGIVLASVLVALVAEGRASAETTIESIGLVGSAQCDAFRQNQDASWTSTRNSVVTLGSSRLAVGGGTTFEKEGTSRKAVAIYVAVGGHDLADVLERTCKTRRS
jgi:hypothetical protein